jgi:hypothetical protein
MLFKVLPFLGRFAIGLVAIHYPVLALVMEFVYEAILLYCSESDKDDEKSNKDSNENSSKEE